MGPSLSSFISKDTRRMLLCEQLAENFKLDESTYTGDLDAILTASNLLALVSFKLSR